MVLNFYPWTIDISDEVIYLEDSISFETNADNMEKFKSVLTNEQIGFFEKLGIDISNLSVDYHLYNSTEIFETRFLLKGKFISLPSSQVKTYLDIEFLNDSILKNIKTTDVSEEDMAKNHIENMQFSFKHPIIYSNKKIYKKWDCGLMIFGIIVLLYVKIFPSFITFFRGNIWKIALIFMGILFVLLGVFNLVHKEN